MVTHPDLELYVTWAALEENLKGIRESLDSALQSPKLVTGGKDDAGKDKSVHLPPKENEQRFTQTVNYFLWTLFVAHIMLLCKKNSTFRFLCEYLIALSIHTHKSIIFITLISIISSCEFTIKYHLTSFKGP